MSYLNTDNEKSDKERIWELGRELVAERYEHEMTKFALREVQGRMDSEKTEHFERRIRELRQEYSNLEELVGEVFASMKVLESERNKLKMELEKQSKTLEENGTRLEEYKEKVRNLEQENQNLRMENEENKKTLEIGKAELKMELERQKEKLKDSEGEWNRMRMEKKKLEGDLKREINDVKEINKDLTERLKYAKSELEKQSEKSANKMKDSETRLKEYKKEVTRLKNTKGRAANCYTDWISDYFTIIDKLIQVLKKTNSKKNKEEVRKLEANKKEAGDEWQFWEDYQDVFWSLLDVLKWVQDEDIKISYIKSTLNEYKASFEEKAERLKKGIEEKPWIKKELDSTSFERWKQLLMKTSERINKS